MTITDNNFRLNSFTPVLISALLTFAVLFCSPAAFAADVQPISFTSSPDPVPALGTVQYTVVFQNNQPTDPAVNPWMELSVPTGFTFLSSIDPAHCSYNGNVPSQGLAADVIRCDWTQFSAPQSTLVFDVQVSAVPGTYTATVTGGADNDINPGNNSEISKTDVVESADLELISKTGTPNPVPASGIVTYRFEVRNNGPFPSGPLQVSDSLPASMTFVADNADPAADDDALWECSASGQDVTCDLASLDVGVTTYFSFRVQVTGNTTGSISNAATIPTDTLVTPDPDHDNNTNSGDIEVIAGTDMSITKAVDTTPVIGGRPAQFRLTVTNEGPMTATGIQVIDTLPGGYTAISAAPDPSSTDWDCTTIIGTEITCVGPDMDPGQTYDIVVTATPPLVPEPPCPTQPVTHQNSAQVTTATRDPITDNNADTASYTVSFDTADLSMSKSKSPSPAAPGQLVKSTIIVANDGPLDASQPITVTDTLSPNETWQGYTGTDWVCTHSSGDTPAPTPGGTVTCSYRRLPLVSGDQAPTLTIDTLATGAGDMTNTACVASDDDGRMCNNCSDAGGISTDEYADLVVDKSVDPADTVIESSQDSFTYTVTVHNSGPDTSQAVDFRDTIPLYVPAGPNGRPATTITAATDQGSCTVNNALVHCSLGDIINGQTVTVSITLTRPMKDGTYTNTASAYSTLTGDPDRTNNVDSVDVTVEPVADVEVTDKSITYSNQPDPIFAGTEATYTINVRNNGPSAAENVVIRDSFSGESFTFIDASAAGGGSCSFTAPILTCDIGTMAPDTIDAITVRIRPDQLTVDPLPSPWQIGNTATVSTDTLDSDHSNDSKTADLNVKKGEADLALVKSESPYFQEPIHFDPNGGEPNQIIYEIVISNRGPSLATGVYFDDHLNGVIPPQTPSQKLKFIRDTSHSDGTTDGNNICNWPEGTEFDAVNHAGIIRCTLPDPIPSGGETTHYLVFEVLTAPDAIFGDSYHNEAVTQGNEEDNHPLNNQENENTTVRTIVDLGIVKDGPVSPVEVGENFDFTLAVTNYGPGMSPLTTVTDNLPGGMELTGTPYSSSSSVVCTGTAGDTGFFCSIDTQPGDPDVMESGTSVNITVPVRLTRYPAGGTITNTASVAGMAPEPFVDPHSNVDDHTVIVYRPATLGNFFWIDANADGIQDGNESGFGGVRVNLLNSSGSAVTDPTTGAAYTTTTSSSGAYSFNIYNAGLYIVEFVKPDNSYLPSPQNIGDDALDSDADANGRTAPIIFSHHAADPIIISSNDTIDAGMYQLVSVGDRVWEDLNADGRQNSGELNIPGVSVELLDDLQNVVGSAATDANGEYLFTDLEPGNYQVQITPPSWVGYLASPVQSLDPNNNNRGDSNIAGSPAPGTYRSGTVTLTSHAEPTNDGDDHNSNLTLDFGLVLPGSIGNIVWLDENSDGIQDAGEPGLANITVELRDENGTLLTTTQTDADGGYLFNRLAPADYFITVDQTTLPAGITQTAVFPHPGADFANQNQSGLGYSVHLTSGGENLTADFGYNWLSGAIGDRVWVDSNGNGIQDPGEVGVSGAEVTLYSAGADGLFWTGDEVLQAATITQSSGRYIFTNLSAGIYGVEVTDSGTASHDILDTGDYSQTGDPDHFAAAASTAPAGTAGDNRSTRPVILAPGDTFINVDFGYQPDGGATLFNIGDTVWMDSSRNGVMDSGETGIPGVTINLLDNTGQSIAATTTDAGGNYLFENLPAAAYTVLVVDSDNILSSYNPTYDNDSGTSNPDGESTLILSADDPDQDFGYAPNSPSGGIGVIGDTVFLDRNDNGSPDTGEGMEGVRVLLYDGTGNLSAVTHTDENGNYYFGGLAADTYTVTVVTANFPPSLLNSVDPDGGGDSTSKLALATGEINLAQDFGFITDTPGSIGNLVWKDQNADGIYQPAGLDGIAGTSDDETIFTGVTLDLYRDIDNNGLIDPGEPKIASTATDAAGSYLFAGLPASSYNVKVTDSQGTLGGHWHSSGAPATDNNSQLEYYPLVLNDGQNIVYADFGYYAQPGSLGDRVFKDVDINGLYSTAADTLLAGVTVFLDIEYPDGTLTTVQAITDTNGTYQFDNLLLDQRYNGIGNSYGSGGEEPSHTVRLDVTTVPAGLTAIYASRGSNTDTTIVGGTPGDEDIQDPGSDNPAGEPGYPPMGSSDTTNDFGYYEPGSIGDTIWNDKNNNGLFDTGEGLDNIGVTLTPPADVDLGAGLGQPFTRTTAGGGQYLFPDLPPGTYTVRVEEATLPLVLQGHNTIDPDGVTDSTANITLTVSSGKVEDNLLQDFAYFFPGAIGNYVWDDSNANGIQDAGESGHQGIAVQLYDGAGNYIDDPLHPGVPYIIQTDAAGAYLFENLIPGIYQTGGTYQVRFIAPAGTLFTSRDSGGDDTLDSDPDSNGLVSVPLADNEINLTVDAGLVGPAINIEKTTNGSDADTPPGVPLNVNDPVNWSYRVTNTGNTALTQVTVSDDKIGLITCPADVLVPGDSMTCTAAGTAAAGQYANTGAVIGTPTNGLPAVIDSDPSHYLAASNVPAVDIEKATNGQDADTGTGPIIAVGNRVTWTYVVTNTGNSELNNVIVEDNQIGQIICPKSTLAIAESMTCTATGTAVAGQYQNIGSVTGDPASGPTVSDSDPSHYFGSSDPFFAAVDIEKSTNGKDADQAPGPYAETGHTVTWTYLVTNTGNVDLNNVTVSDDRVPDSDIHCPNDGNTDNRITLLRVGTSATCTAAGSAVAGQYVNTGSVIGTPPTGPDVTDSDPSHYFGSRGSIDIEKYTNGKDADIGTGPYIRTGQKVYWKYVVTNTGHFTLNHVTVTDDMGVAVSCPKTSLAAGETMTCTGQGTAGEGQYENIGTAAAATPEQELVSDYDPSHYFGKSFFWPLFTAAIIPRCPPVPDFCYMVADGDNEGSIDGALFKYTFKNDTMELLNRLGAPNVESIVLSLDGQTLYATDDGQFGIIDPTANIYDSFTPFDPRSRDAGVGRGKIGPIPMADIDGLAFDPQTGILYGTNRHGDGLDGQLDLLIQLNPATGKIIADAFGPGIDYLVIESASIGTDDIDDIAIDLSGNIYAVAGNSGGVGNDHLVTIDKTTGAVTDQGPLHLNNSLIQDMEGLTLYNSRTLYGTTGIEFSNNGTSNKLYKIEKHTGITEFITPLDQNFNGYIPEDFEAIECFPVCK